MKAQVAVYTALLAIFACLVGMAPAADTPQRETTICFPASSWDANDADRPCVATSAPKEDGSVRVVQRRAHRAVAICVLPNPTEESGRYEARCYRR